MNVNHVFKSPRPALTIEFTGSRSLGRCYSEATCRVTSTTQLNLEALRNLRAARVVGIGQECEFYLMNGWGKRTAVPEGVQEPTAHDEVECTEVDEAGKPTGRTPINRYTGQGYAPAKMGYWVYEVVTRCDSGD